jgi:hypothetical protein
VGTDKIKYIDAGGSPKRCPWTITRSEFCYVAELHPIFAKLFPFFTSGLSHKDSVKEIKFIFENKEHDFPQKIIYHFVSESKLNASIEGEEMGKLLDGNLVLQKSLMKIRNVLFPPNIFI